MPRAGYTAITIREIVRKRLDEIASKLGKNSQETILFFVEKYETNPDIFKSGKEGDQNV